MVVLRVVAPGSRLPYEQELARGARREPRDDHAGAAPARARGAGRGAARSRRRGVHARARRPTAPTRVCCASCARPPREIHDAAEMRAIVEPAVAALAAERASAETLERLAGHNADMHAADGRRLPLHARRHELPPRARRARARTRCWPTPSSAAGSRWRGRWRCCPTRRRGTSAASTQHAALLDALGERDAAGARAGDGAPRAGHRARARPDADHARLVSARGARARDRRSATGTAGPLDAITDVAGVRVGSVTLIEGDDVRTGVTVIVPSEADVGVRAAVRRLPHAQRQRRADRARVGARVRAADDADRAHQHAQRRRRARRAGGRTRWRRAASDDGSTGRCRWSARPGTGCSTTSTASTCAPSTSTRRSRRPRGGAGRGGRRRRRHRHDLPRLQGRDRHRLARGRRGARRLHGRRARAGQPRLARAADASAARRSGA